MQLLALSPSVLSLSLSLSLIVSVETTSYCERGIAVVRDRERQMQNTLHERDTRGDTKTDAGRDREGLQQQKERDRGGRMKETSTNAGDGEQQKQIQSE